MSILHLPLYTIYKDPSDYPGMYVVREFRIVRGSLDPVAAKAPMIVTPKIQEARARIPFGCVPIMRRPEDDPCIVETWL